MTCCGLSCVRYSPINSRVLWYIYKVAYDYLCQCKRQEISHIFFYLLSYPENGVVEMQSCNVRPRARTILRWEQLQEGMIVMVNYNMETPEERGFWFDAQIQTLNQTSRTNKELRVKILIG